ncbi:hypothetical protein GCM10009851_25290 [Herbiconiux moechotypicola]|uniref:Transposase n=1 Tax=Herbiconiux moechotypicola TaxID=637393 RepID=A0ABN3DQ64_9MICO
MREGLVDERLLGRGHDIGAAATVDEFTATLHDDGRSLHGEDSLIEPLRNQRERGRTLTTTQEHRTAHPAPDLQACSALVRRCARHARDELDRAREILRPAQPLITELTTRPHRDLTGNPHLRRTHKPPNHLDGSHQLKHLIIARTRKTRPDPTHNTTKIVSDLPESSSCGHTEILSD